MARAQLRLLQDRAGTERLHHPADRIGLVAHHHPRARRQAFALAREPAGCPQDMGDQRQSPDLMEHLGPLGFQPGTFAGRQDHDGQFTRHQDRPAHTALAIKA